MFQANFLSDRLIQIAVLVAQGTDCLVTSTQSVCDVSHMLCGLDCNVNEFLFIAVVDDVPQLQDRFGKGIPDFVSVAVH